MVIGRNNKRRHVATSGNAVSSRAPLSCFALKTGSCGGEWSSKKRGVRGVARNKLLLKNVHATRFATAVKHPVTLLWPQIFERMEHIPEGSRAALRGNEDL